jgi:hypothetical protein
LNCTLAPRHGHHRTDLTSRPLRFQTVRNYLMLGFAAITEKTHEIYEGELSTETEMIHNLAVPREIDRTTGGHARSISKATVGNGIGSKNWRRISCRASA